MKAKIKIEFERRIKNQKWKSFIKLCLRTLKLKKMKTLIENAMRKAKAINDAVYWEDVKNRTSEVNKCLDEVWNMLGG